MTTAQQRQQQQLAVVTRRAVVSVGRRARSEHNNAADQSLSCLRKCMMDSIDRSSIASRSSTSRPQTRWRRGGAEHQQSELDQPPRPGTAKTTVSSSGGDRPSSRRGIKSLAHDVSSMSSGSSNGTGGMQRPPTSSGRMTAALSRPPSAARTSMQSAATMNNLPISAASLSRHQLHSMLDRPVTQQGLAGVRRSASSKGVPRLARQMQDKKYYEQLLQSKIRELEQQMVSIRRDMEAASGGGGASTSQGQSTRGLLATRLQELQAQLDEYNAVLDKMNSGWYRENAQADLYSENPAGNSGNYDSARHEAGASSQELDIIQLFQKRQRLDSAYNKIQWNLNANRKLAKKIVESMDADTRKRSKLPSHIPLSPMKLEACRLYQKIFEDDGKDKLDLAATRKQIAELEKRTAEAQEELEQLEQCIEEAQAEGNFKFHDNEGRSSGSGSDRVYSSKLQKSRAEELQRLSQLEDEIVERLERMTSGVNANFDSNLLSNDELELLQTLMDMNSENSQDKTIDELRQDNAKLATLSARLGELEAKITAEMAAVERKRPSLLTGPNNRTFDSSGDSEIYGEMTEEDALDEQQQRDLLMGLGGDHRSAADLDEARLDYDLLKEKIETNDIYRPISILEDKLCIVGGAYNGNNKSSSSIVLDETGETSDEQLLEKLFKLATQYNEVLIKELKTIF